MQGGWEGTMSRTPTGNSSFDTVSCQDSTLHCDVLAIAGDVTAGELSVCGVCVGGSEPRLN